MNVSSSFTATSDRDRCAVHIHLAVADLVEPCPSKRVLARCYTWWDFVLKLRSTIAVGILFEVALCLRGTATFNTMDNHPLRVLRRLGILSK